MKWLKTAKTWTRIFRKLRLVLRSEALLRRVVRRDGENEWVRGRGGRGRGERAAEGEEEDDDDRSKIL